MPNPQQRSITELLTAYRDYLLSKVSKVRILGEADERELKEVFVELSIVDRRAPRLHAEFRGMLDSAMRQRLNPFADDDDDMSPELSEKRSVKPDELLRHRTRAIIMGAPGSGKTTLLKYLALQAQEKQKRLVVWLELKAIDKYYFAQAEKDAAHDGNQVLLEFWLKHLKVQLSLGDGEIKLLRAYWQEKFNVGEVAVFLDGFDELQDQAIERDLNKCVREFVSASHNNTLLISTRPYAHDELGKERLQELEIEPLNQRRIEAFLHCYYPNDHATKNLLKTLRERSSLRELLHVPLLLGIMLRLHREGRFAEDRLDLYETIIADLVHELDRSKSVNRLFKINDNRLRLDFLKFLAFERLLRDPLEEAEQGVHRIAFSYNLIKEKARIFLKQERLSHNSRDLADDVLATPLLREVGSDTFAFTHLTLEEYLAARAFAAFHNGNEFEGLKIFCRAYHNPTIVEMEVLPMTLGALGNVDKLYAEIERWPESLNFVNLRLRARALAYSAEINPERLSELLDRLVDFISGKIVDERPYEWRVVNSFVGVSHQMIAMIEAKAISLVESNAVNFEMMADALWQIGSRHVFAKPISTSNDQDISVRSTSDVELERNAFNKEAEALAPPTNKKDSRMSLRQVFQQFRLEQFTLSRKITARKVNVAIASLNNGSRYARLLAVDVLERSNSEKAVDALISALDDKDDKVRLKAAQALEQLSPEKAIDALSSALNDKDEEVRAAALYALQRIGTDKAIGVLISALDNDNRDVNSSAVYALEKIGSEQAIEALISALNSKKTLVRIDAFYALNRICSESAIKGIIATLNNQDFAMRSYAVYALEQIGSDQAIDALISALDNDNDDIVDQAACALGEIGSDKAVDALLSAMKSENRSTRAGAVSGLEKISSDKSFDALISALSDEDGLIRGCAAQALEKFGSDKTIAALVLALKDEDYFVRECAADTLGQLRSTKAVSWLISALNDEDSEVGDSAANALAQFKIEMLISGLEQTIEYGDAFARRKATAVIGYYSDDRQTLDRLNQLALTAEDSQHRAAAKEATRKFARKLELLGHFVAESAAQTLNDNESRELFLVGEVYKVTAEAGHIFRTVSNSDWGIDGEIEFKNYRGEASGQRVYLQLKSGDSYLRKRKMDDKEIFTIKNTRHAEYWPSHRYPVLLVIRDSTGRIRWMNVSDYLQRHGANTRQIEFQGEPFTAESIRQMRARFAR